MLKKLHVSVEAVPQVMPVIHLEIQFSPVADFKEFMTVALSLSRNRS
jgi:hypothetical protein